MGRLTAADRSDHLDLVFQALADATRRQMVARLVRGPATVSVLAEPHAMSLPAVLQHLHVLEASGLVRSAKSGRVRTCSLDAATLQGAEQWLSARRAAWDQRLDRLADLLARGDDLSD